MYRQGLGDCFLLTFSDGDATSRILIDCGVLLGTPGGGERMERVVQDIHTATGGRLDALVVTHEHWDHVSGFLQAAKVFKTFKEIRQVWLAWTEDPINAVASSLRRKRHQTVASLRRAVAQMRDAETELRAAAGGPASPRERVQALLDFFGPAPEADAPAGEATADLTPQGLGLAAAPDRPRVSKTEEALNAARDLGAEPVRICDPAKPPFMLPGVKGVRVYVLGPPQDEAFLKRSNPTKAGKEVYELGLDADTAFFAAADPTMERDAIVGSRPFDGCYMLTPKEAGHYTCRTAGGDGPYQFFMEHYGGFEGIADGSDIGWRRIDHDWLEVASRLALKLDNDTNNTSLALAFEFTESGKVLLFPGDAQVGNWQSWSSLSWTFRDERGVERTVPATDLLRRTVLYKVGHHASHNATLREKGLELMTSPDLVAMIPVDEKAAHAKRPKRWDMPFPPLLRRLAERTRGRILRADRAWPEKRETRRDPDGILTDAGAAPDGRPALTDPEWKAFLRDTELDGAKDLYIEHTVNA